ncbi:MAG: hypothetical protein HOE10_08285 [Deltaproteobacteria bacterium]|jgi:hypothetical protein|nr:hypothetical protein [Deltaproteobacteria bacterium]
MTKLPSTTTLLIGFFILVQLPLLIQPIGGGHIWRQAATASVARNLAVESFDPFHPRIDLREQHTGITGMEFPVYQSLVGLLYLVTPTTEDWQGRLVSLLMALGCIVYTILLANLLVHIPTKWVVFSIICLQEFFLLATRFMPEMTALFLAMMGTFHFIRYKDSGKPKDLFFAWLGLTLGILARPYVAAWGLIVLVEFLITLRSNPKRAFVFFTLGITVLIPFVLWYFFWSPHLSDSYGLKNHFFSGGNAEEILTDILSIETWIKLANTILYDYCNWLLVPFVIIGLLKIRSNSNWKRDHTVLLVGVPLLTIVIVLSLTGDHFKPHTYYFVSLIPSLTIFAGMGMFIFERHYPIAGKRILFFLPLLTVSLLWYIYPAHIKDLRPFEEVLSEVKQNVHRNDLVVSEDVGSYNYTLHPIRRRGWVVGRNKIEDFNFIKETKRLGARWVLHLENGKYKLHTISSWLQYLKTEK